MLEVIYIIAMMLFLFGITIFVHEWGHFIVAKRCGLVIEAFSIGMGPALWKKEIDGIVYKIGAFPIGGYVSLPQLDPEGMEKVQGDNSETPRSSLPEVSPWHKIAVALAGPLCNVIFALLLALIVFLVPNDGFVDEKGVFVAQVEESSSAAEEGLMGGDQILEINGNVIKSWYEARVECLLGGGEDQVVELTVENPDSGRRQITLAANSPEESEQLFNGVHPASPCQILAVTDESPAEEAGLQADDILIRINGRIIQGTEYFIDVVQENSDTELTLEIERDGERMNKTVTPRYSEAHDMVMIGIQFGGALSLPWTLSGNPLEQVKSDASSIFRLLKALTTKGEAKQAASGLGGPVAIFTMIWIALKMGIINAIGLIRFININLAVLNLLPIPVLDGGHICFALWEGITRRKVHPKVVITLVNIFAILLIGAMLFLSWRDVDRNWNVSRFFKGSQTNQTEQVEQPAPDAE